MSSFVAAGTAYSTHGINMIPFFFYYSIFGFQRIGDLIWAAGDAQTRGFLLGATAGRTTLAGEGLQHQDGHSHLLAYPNPSVLAYDPAFAYELAVIMREGLRRMLEEGENIIYYITIMNELYPMPAKPEGVDDGILKGIYRFKSSKKKKYQGKAHLLGSGTILNQAIQARQILEENYNVAADVWSVTSYKNLYWDAMETERWNLRHFDQKPRQSFLEAQLGQEKDVFVAASDYLKALPAGISKWIPGPVTFLGTDGYGRSESRDALRDFFEVDARHIVFTALSMLAKEKKLDVKVVKQAVQDLEIDLEKENPLFS
jgi:pyruvate dehydrogenase E1 component